MVALHIRERTLPRHLLSIPSDSEIVEEVGHWAQVPGSGFKFQVSGFKFGYAELKVQVSNFKIKKILKTQCLEDFFMISHLYFEIVS